MHPSFPQYKQRMEMSSEKINMVSKPRIHCLGTVDSCMDEAFRLIREDRLPVWDSTQASMQTAGRGQMRRKWESLSGNLFAALRLPDKPPFSTSAGAIAIGALCASALRSLGCTVYLKWPNDLIMFNNDQIEKIGGILLEERPEGLVAGIGINVASAPMREDLDRPDSIVPGILRADEAKTQLPGVWEFWRALVKHIYSLYKNSGAFGAIWQGLADELLLWRGLKVQVMVEGSEIEGILLGVGENGAALLKTSSGIEEIIHGQMYVEDSGKPEA